MAREDPPRGASAEDKGRMALILESERANGKPKADATLESAIAPQLGLDLGGAEQAVAKANPGLADKFLVPPFSVFDTRAGYWQERRRAWLSVGFRGEMGRGEGMIYEGVSGAARKALYDGTDITEASASLATGTSVFDPVLCEIAYRWFSGPNAQVLDPFAGGVVRGALAAALGRRYVGVELRPEQVADNRAQAAALFEGEGALDFGREVSLPRWVEGDATKMHEHDLPFADLVFTCPPYADLEVYSDDPRDLSTMKYEQFREALFGVMADSAALLHNNRFAVWVVGEARGKDGRAYGFVSDTVQAARAAGLALYNEAILVNSVGSAALRAQRIIRSRKLTRVHQHVFTFVKGDPKRAAEACGRAEVDV